MDLKSFLDRTHLTKADVLRKLGRDPKSSLLSAYQSGASSPSFEMVFQLLKLGMTPLEMFGKEIDDTLRDYYTGSSVHNIPQSFNTPEFREGLANANNPEFNAEVQKVVLEMMKKGMIK